MLRQSIPRLDWKTSLFRQAVRFCKVINIVNARNTQFQVEKAFLPRPWDKPLCRLWNTKSQSSKQQTYREGFGMQLNCRLGTCCSEAKVLQECFCLLNTGLPSCFRINQHHCLFSPSQIISICNCIYKTAVENPEKPVFQRYFRRNDLHC